ncbi:MAG: hypothetical protein IB618_01950 [Candidatus Pacearchaeota archaeon]|nr:MAG: hypothetical protein IB618_01950 [Candidatus Pacearchaeota archaeon]
MKNNLITKLEGIGAENIYYGDGRYDEEKKMLEEMSNANDPTFLKARLPINFTYKSKKVKWLTYYDPSIREFKEKERSFYYQTNPPLFLDYSKQWNSLKDLEKRLNNFIRKKLKEIDAHLEIGGKYIFEKHYSKHINIKIQLEEFLSFIRSYEDIREKIDSKTKEIEKEFNRRVRKNLIPYFSKLKEKVNKMEI